MKYHYLLVCLFCMACGNYSVDLASETAQEGKVFCSPFNKGGFEGTITIKVHNSYSYEPDSSFLTFSKVPQEFRDRVESYIQIFSIINVSEKEKKFKYSSEPHGIKTLNRHNRNYLPKTTYVDHQFIRYADSSVSEFFYDYGFEVLDTAGKKALRVSLFNVKDQPISSVVVLVPPFTANPHTFKDDDNINRHLAKIHPFYELINSTEDDEDDLFLSKAETACRRT